MGNSYPNICSDAMRRLRRQSNDLKEERALTYSLYIPYYEFSSRQKNLKREIFSDLKNKSKGGTQEDNHIENYIILLQNFFHSDEEMKKLHILLARSSAEMPSNLEHYQRSLITSPLVSKTTSFMSEKNTINSSALKEIISNECLYLGLNSFIEKLLNVLKTRYDPELLKKKYLKKMCSDAFLTLKMQLLKELKDCIIEPAFKILEFLYSEFFEKYKNQKNAILLTIYDQLFNIIFKFEFGIYSLVSNIYHVENTNSRKKLKNKLKIEKFRSIDSYDVDKFFLFETTSSTLHSSNLNEKDAYSSVIQIIENIKKKQSPVAKLELIAQIRPEILQTTKSIKFIDDFLDRSNLREIEEKLDVDNMISLTSYIIFNCGDFDLHTEIMFVQDFLNSNLYEDFEYHFNIFQSALDYVTNEMR